MNLRIRSRLPGLALEPGPQRSDRTVRRSSEQAVLLVMASLADAVGDGVDAATLSFLTARALEDRRKEEEEVARKRKEQLIARRQEASLELDSLLLPFERRTAWEDERMTELHRLLERLDRERPALIPSVK